MYDLSPALPSKDYYWEAIDIKPRACSFFNVNEWLTMTVLVCKTSVANSVAELVRSVLPRNQRWRCSWTAHRSGSVGPPGMRPSLRKILDCRL